MANKHPDKDPFTERALKIYEDAKSQLGYNVCGFDFGKAYGELGEGYIHVHHLVPFAPANEQRDTNPIEDSRPVCPNCHAMLHRRNPPIPVAELKALVRNLRA
jgi:5-methylcytosine-specific restriction protein A